MNDQALKDKVVSGLRWTVLTRGTTQLFTWVATLIVARLLNPSDYGLVAMATIVSSYLMLLGEMGFSVALIQRRELDETTRRSVFGFLLLGGGILFVALSGFAPLISRYFSEPRLTPLILVVGVQFLLIPFSVIPQANLSIAMRFRALGTAGLASATMGAVTTLWLAYCHFGAYALVVGTVVTAFSRAVILNILAPFLRRPLLRARLVSKLANFSGYVLLERTVWYWYAQADTVIAGSMLGAAGLGAYVIGKQLAMMPFERFAEIMNTVATPAYSSVQEDLSRVKAMYLKTVRFAAMIAIPAFWGLALVAPCLVQIVLGEKWRAAVPILQLLCLSMPLRTLGSLAPSALQSIGRPDISLRCIVWAAAIVSGALAVGIHWGVVGMAAGWAVGYPIAYVINSISISHTLGATMGEVLRPLAKPLVCGAIMAVGTYLEMTYLGAHSAPILRLAAGTVTGCILFGFAAWILARRELRELFDFGRTLSRG